MVEKREEVKEDNIELVLLAELLAYCYGPYSLRATIGIWCLNLHYGVDEMGCFKKIESAVSFFLLFLKCARHHRIQTS